MINKNLAIALTAAGTYIGGALALKAAERAGFVPHDTALRAFAVFTGLSLAVYANFLPKRLGTFRNPASALRMRRILGAFPIFPERPPAGWRWVRISSRRPAARRS